MINTIMLIDDDPAIRDSLTNAIRAIYPSILIDLGQNLSDADYYIYDEEKAYDLMIIDFSYGAYDYEFPGNVDWLLERSNRGLSGWIWIQKFLREHPTYDRERIIGLSAYTDLLSPSEIEQVGIRVIGKQSRDSVRQILNNIHQLTPLN